MKILYFIEDLGPGGKERQLTDLVQNICVREGIQCILVVMSKRIHYKKILKSGIPIHYLLRKNKKDWRILPRFYKICKELKPDILHTWGAMTSVYATPVAKLLGIRIVNGMVRGAAPMRSISDKYYIAAFLTFPFSDAIVSNSQAGLDAFKAPPQKSIRIFNGFDRKRILALQDPVALRDELGIKTDKVVGMVASVSERKDYDTYLRSAEKILQTNGNITFVAVGGGADLEKYRYMVKNRFEDKIKFLGTRSDVESLINMFDIGVLTTNTRVHNEGISNAIMEYMALGKPVVATNSGGTKELVQHDKTGFIVAPGDPDQLAHNITILLNNPHLAENMGLAGKKRIEEVFSTEKMVRTYHELYVKTINR